MAEARTAFNIRCAVNKFVKLLRGIRQARRKVGWVLLFHLIFSVSVLVLFLEFVASCYVFLFVYAVLFVLFWRGVYFLFFCILFIYVCAAFL